MHSEYRCDILQLLFKDCKFLGWNCLNLQMCSEPLQCKTASLCINEPKLSGKTMDISSARLLPSYMYACGFEVNGHIRKWWVKFLPPVLSLWASFSYHRLFSPSSASLRRAVHRLFEVASKRKWGRKSIIDFAFCLTQTPRTKKKKTSGM